MIVIREADLGIACDNGKCTRAAFYIVTVHDPNQPSHKLYCPQCTAKTLQRVVALLRIFGDERELHECIETDHLLTGEAINSPVDSSND